MITKKILLAIVVSQSLFSCNKNKNENKNPATKNEIQKEKLPQENNNIVEPDNVKELKKSANLDPKNLFLKYCLNDGKSFNNCNFKDLFNEHNQNNKNKMKYTVKYQFKDCNFDKLNIGINSNSIRKTEGIETLKLENYRLVLQDIYEWDTKTNEYDLSCFFNIESIETSFSDFTKNKINDYIAIIQDHKSFIESVKNLNHSFSQITSLIAKLNPNNINSDLNQVIQNISLAKEEHKDDETMRFALEEMKTEIDKFQNSEMSADNIKNVNEFKNKLNTLVIEATELLDTTEAIENMETMKMEVNAILKNGESILNFNQAELQQFKDELSKQLLPANVLIPDEGYPSGR